MTPTPDPATPPRPDQGPARADDRPDPSGSQTPEELDRLIELVNDLARVAAEGTAAAAPRAHTTPPPTPRRDAGKTLPKDPPGPRPGARTPNEAKRRLVLLAIVLVASSIVSPLIGTFLPAANYAVASDSMAPSIPRGSLVSVMPGPVDKGDVIVYWSPVAGSYQLHRVVEVLQAAGGPVYVTQGDANDAPDSYAVPPEDVRGVLRFSVPWVGLLWLIPLPVQAGIFFGLVLAYLAITAWDARAAGRPHRAGAAATLMVLLLVSTSAMGGLGAAYVGSGTGLDVADPSVMPMTAGTNGTVTLTHGGNNASTTLPGTKVWKEIELCARCPFDVTSVTNTGPSFGYTRFDAADFDATVQFFFEAWAQAPSGRTLYVTLYDRAAAATVAGSEVSTTSTDGVLLRSGAFSLPSGERDYEFRARLDATGGTGKVFAAKLVSAEVAPERTLTRVMLAPYVGTTSGSTIDHSGTRHWEYDADWMDGIAEVTFEVLAKNSGIPLGDSTVTLTDTSNNVIATANIGGTTVTQRRIDVSTSSLTDGTTYKVRHNRVTGADALEVFMVQLEIRQDTFARTTGYVALAEGATTTQANATLGWDARLTRIDQPDGTVHHLEATMRTSSSGSPGRVYLRDEDESEMAALVTSSTSFTRVRTTNLPLPWLNATYHVSVTASGTSTTTLNGAWVVQHVPVRDGDLWKEFVLTACGTGSDSCGVPAQTNAYVPVPGSKVRINLADYDPDPVFFIEAMLQADAGTTVYAALIVEGIGTPIAEVSTTATTPTLVRSGGFTLSGDETYVFQRKSSDALGGGTVLHFKVVAKQQGAGATMTQYDMVRGSQASHSDYRVPGRGYNWTFDAGAWDGLTRAFFEVVATQDSGSTAGSSFRLVDNADDSTVATLTIGSADTLPVRVRSTDILGSLVEGHEYRMEYKRDAADAVEVHLSHARVILAQVGFDRTVSYNSLTGRAQTSATSFTSIGYETRYDLYTQRHNATTYIEAFLRTTTPGVAGQVRIVDENDVVYGPTLETASTTLARVRSDPVTLSTANTTYQPETRITGSGVVDVRAVFLITHINYLHGHAHDDLVRSTPPATGGGCTWSVWVQYRDGTNLDRLSSANVTLRADTGAGMERAVQIRVLEGTALASGTRIEPAAGMPVIQGVSAAPLSHGISTIRGWLRADCGGIHTSQPVEYVIR